jgi:hypothetical protein
MTPELGVIKADGKWHLYPEPGSLAPEKEALRAAEDPATAAVRTPPAAGKTRRKRR